MRYDTQMQMLDQPPQTAARRPLFGVAALIIIVAVTTLGIGCSKEKEEAGVVVVQLAAAERTTIHRTIHADAILFPIQQAALRPKISAPVAEFFINRGSPVHKGQLLATLENRDLTASEMENKGGFAQAQAAYESATRMSLPEEIQKAEFDLETAKKSLDAEQKVFESRQELFKQGALPRKDWDQAIVSYTQARAQYEIANKHLKALMDIGKSQELKAAEGQLTAAQGKYMGASAQLSYSEIRSPIDGVVTDRPLYRGETASADSPLLVVMDISQIVARAHIPQEDAALLKPGNPATLFAPGLEQPASGQVMLVSPATDANSTTLEVWVRVPNKNHVLKPGTTGKLTIVAESVKDAIVVPAAALLTTEEGEKVVMLAGNDGCAHKQKVEVGVTEGDKVQITAGVQAGVRVITTGAYGLPDQAKIKADEGGGAEGKGDRAASKEEEQSGK